MNELVINVRDSEVTHSFPSSSMSSTSYLEEENIQSCDVTSCSIRYDALEACGALTCWWSGCSWPPQPGSTARLRPRLSPSLPLCRPVWPRSRCWQAWPRTEGGGWRDRHDFLSHTNFPAVHLVFLVLGGEWVTSLRASRSTEGASWPTAGGASSGPRASSSSWAGRCHCKRRPS